MTSQFHGLNFIMVSTRGAKLKFGDGEKVLCYEPDPKKVKVLYDAKVLEASFSKDNRGRKIPEYLVHFNGWNSSWDRCVNDRLILKDNEENRALQKRLAEDAAVHLRGGKKRRRIAEILKGGGRCKRKQLDSGTSETSFESSDCDDSSEMSNNCQSGNDFRNTPQKIENGPGGRSESDSAEDAKPVEIQIPDKLRKKLEEDYILINKSKKLLNLPCNPNVVMILEGFVKSFVGSQVCCALEKAKNDVNYSRVEKNVNLCKEVADGLRIYFDFTLPVLLIYNAERLQYENFRLNYRPNAAKAQISGELERLDAVANLDTKVVLARLTPKKLSNRGHLNCPLPQTPNTSTPDRNKRHSKCVKKENAEELTAHVAGELPRRILRSNFSRAGSFSETLEVPDGSITKTVEDRPTKATRSNQKIKIHVPVAEKASPRAEPPSPKQPCCSSACNSTCQPASVAISNCSSPSKSCGSPTTPKNPHLPSADCSSLLNGILTWKLLPRDAYETTPAAPSVVYGAQHLLRLLVKLPDLLTRSNMPEKKVNALHQHLETFLEYLAVRHEQLFSSSAYTEALAVMSTGKMMPN